jgi:hypothetical protein
MDELLAEVKAVRRSDMIRQRRIHRIKQLLVQARMEDPALKVADLEEKIGRFYDRATISRITVPELRKAAAAPRPGRAA